MRTAKTGFEIGLLALFCLSGCTQTLEGEPSPGDGQAGTSAAGSSASGSSGTAGASGATSTGGAAGTGSQGGGGSTTGGGGTGGVLEPPPDVLVPNARMARLSRVQWSNTVRDLLGLADITDIERDVTGDAVVGFDNDVESLFVSDNLRADLYVAAEKLATRVVSDSATLARLVPADAPSGVAGKARAFVTGFGLRALRRPLTDAEVTTYLALFDQGPTLYPTSDAFAAGATLVIQALLQSPYFMYRPELGTTVVDGKIALEDYEIASKLSYALANTLPDDELFGAAARHELTNTQSIVEHASRLLASARGAQARDHFHFQVFRLGAYDGIVRDASVFPEFTPSTPAAMREEVLAFLRYVFDQGKGVTEMYTAPVSFVNATLAPLYGLSGRSSAFERVDLDPTQRAGLLTQPGFLSSYAVVNDPDTIHRGVFVNQRILCVDLPPPDPAATGLAPITNDMTNRERVDATTGDGTCGAGCHSAIINPPGFAFENFDAVGKFRTTDRNKPINAASSYDFIDGPREFDGPIEFTRALAESIQPHTCYAQNWLSYLNGRGVSELERPRVDYLASRSRAGTLATRDLLLSVVTNPSFFSRLP